MRQSFQNAIDVIKHLIIPEPDYPVSFAFQMPRSFRVITLPARVLPAIQLNDNSFFGTNKIGNIRRDRHLPFKFQIAKLPVPQL